MTDTTRGEGVEGQHWADKTSTPIGVDLSQPASALRYHFLEGQELVYTQEKFPDGSVARGIITRAEFEGLTGLPLGEYGWYNAWGQFLGEDPAWPAD